MPYTLAIGDDMLLATVPDGADIGAAVAAEAAAAGWDPIPAFRVEPGCTLSEDCPEDVSSIIWHSGNAGWLMDESDRVWTYAVRQKG